MWQRLAGSRRNADTPPKDDPVPQTSPATSQGRNRRNFFPLSVEHADAGILAADNLNPQKARILLALALPALDRRTTADIVAHLSLEKLPMLEVAAKGAVLDDNSTALDGDRGLGFASFGAKQYAEGIHWELRALNDKPGMIQPLMALAICYVGANEIAKARDAFGEGQRRAPEFFKSRLEGNSFRARPEDRKRALTFLRIAAGPEDSSAADELR